MQRLLVLGSILTLAVAAGAATPSKSDRRCILKSGAGVRQVAAAARADVRRCVERAAQPLSVCLAGRPQGRLAKAAATVARREVVSCAQPPAFGFAPGAAATAAIDAERRFAVTVLPDAVAASASAAACRRSLLRAAGRCTDRFLAEYLTCASRALPTATDELALVRCKGVDPRGRVARACGEQLRDIACAGTTADALFPGCAGVPLAACLAGHAKAAASRALNDGTGLCPVAPPPPAPEPIDLAVVPLPADAESAQFPWWSADGSRIVFAASLAGVPRTQIASVAPDGSGFRCLTCPIASAPGPILTKPIPFSDGTRVMVRVGNQTPVSAADHAVLECAPSVLDCQTPTLVPIEPPSATDPNVTQDQRELRPAPDGEHVGFTQVREAVDGEPTAVAIAGRLVRGADRYVVEDARVVSTLGELKQFAPDEPAAAIVAAFSQSPFGAANPDAVRVDLRNGTVTRVTSHPDYDEPVELSPDGGWFLVGSGRGGAFFFSVFSQVPRPGLVNPGLEVLTSFLFLTQRDPLLEPWLVDRFGERGDYIGQQLNPGSRAQGWDGRMIMNWHPDGTRIVFWEGATTAAAVPDSRLVVATLSSRTPVMSPIAPAFPSLSWAPPLAGYVPPAVAPASRAGLVSGTAQVTYSAATPRRLVVTYTNFSDDGRAIVDGDETAVYTPGLTGETTYEANVALRGCRQGFLRATSAHVALSGITGRVESEVDGRYLALGD
jgi:hypothetical protein